jgi:hypothetical protein
MKNAWRHTLLVLAAGCILPPPVGLDNSTNQPPYVIAGESKPPTAAVEINLACSVCTFQVAAEDPDVGDTLTTLWFWDYDSGQPLQGPDVTIPPTVNGAARSLASYPVRQLTQLATELSSVTSGNVHTLQVIVSDRGFVSGGQQPDQTPQSGGLTATLRWTVTFVTRGTSCDTLSLCTP